MMRVRGCSLAEPVTTPTAADKTEFFPAKQAAAEGLARLALMAQTPPAKAMH